VQRLSFSAKKPDPKYQTAFHLDQFETTNADVQFEAHFEMACISGYWGFFGHRVLSYQNYRVRPISIGLSPACDASVSNREDNKSEQDSRVWGYTVFKSRPLG
jgi:hypothetical protein